MRLPNSGGAALRVFTLLVLLLLYSEASAQTCTSTFTNGGGDDQWTTPGNWSPAGVPGSSANACINAGSTVTLSIGTQTINSLTSSGVLIFSAGSLSLAGPSTATDLTLSGGTLNGAGSLTVTGTLSWTSGTISGTGPLLIPASGTLNISGSNLKDLTVRPLTMAGTATWSGTGNIRTGLGATIVNSGTWGVQNDQTISNALGGNASTFTNSGTFQKTAGIATTTISIAFNNNGAVSVQSGTLSLTNGGSSSGPFTAGGAGLAFGGNHTITGSVTAGTLTVFSSTTTFNNSVSAGAAIFSGGTANLTSSYAATASTTISGGTANFTGSLIGLGTFTIPAGIANFSNTEGSLTLPALTLSTGTALTGTSNLTVNGTLTWTGGSISGTGALLIPAGGTLNLSGPDVKDLTIRPLMMAGTATWSGIGNIRTGLGATIVNSGTWDVQNDQTISNALGGNASTFTNSGTFQKTAGIATTTISIAFNNNGAVSVQSGTLSLTNGGSSSGPFTAGGAGLAFGGNHTITGSVTAGTLTVFSSTTTFNNSVSAGAAIFSGGTANLTSSYAATASTTISGGTANFTGSLIGLGTFTIPAGIANFSNTEGSLTLPALTLSTGTALAGTSNVTVNGTVTWTGGSISGTGALLIPTGGTLNLSGPDVKDLTVRPLMMAGTATWSGSGNIRTGLGATIVNSGTWDVQNDQTISNALGGNASTFTNSGTFQKTAGIATTTISIAFNNNGAVSVQSGTLSLTNGGSSSGPFTAGGAGLAFGGNHTITGSVTAGTLTVFSSTTTFNNSVSAGAAIFSGGTANLTSSYAATASTTISGGTANFTGSLIGLGTFTIPAGIANFSNTEGSLTLPALTLSTGTALAGTSNVTVNGTVTWTGGSISGTGALLIPAGGTLNLSGPDVKDLTIRPLMMAGTATWSGSGNIRTGLGATIVNSGTWDVQNDQTISNALGGNASTFTNSGTFQKTAGIATTTISIAFNNNGAVSVQSGTLNLTNGGSSSGPFSASGAGLTFGGNHTITGSVTAGTLTVFSSTTTFNNSVSAGAAIFSGGTANLSSSYTATTSTTISGGTSNFTGSLISLGTFTIPAGTANFSNTEGSLTLPALTLSTGTALTGTSNLTVTGTLNWTGGIISGSGTLFIPASGTWNLSGPDPKDLQSRPVSMAGTAIWSGTGNIRTGSSALIANSGTWDVQNDQMLANGLGGPGSTFTNTGIFQKSAGTATTTISIVFNNNGAVNVQSGTLNLTGGGSSSGTFTASGAGLTFGGVHLLAGSVTAGTLTFTSSTTTLNNSVSAGAAIFSGGTTNLTNSYAATTSTTISGGTANFTGSLISLGTFTIPAGTANFSNTEGSLTLPALTLSTGTALTGTSNLTVTGTLTWTGGNISGSGTLLIPAGGTINLSGPDPKDLQSRPVSMAGTATWSGSGNIRTGSGAVITNSGSWDLQSDQTISNVFGGSASTFTNTGTFKKTAGTATSTISIAFNNNGAVNVQSGTLSLANGGSSSGTFTATGAGLTFVGGHTLGGSVTAGTLTFNSSTTTVNNSINAGAVSFIGGVTNLASSYTATTSTTLNGGTANFTGSLISLGTFTIPAGTANFSNTEGSLTLPSVILSTGAALTGSSNLTVTGTLTWTGGNISGTGTLLIPANGTMNLSGPDPKDLQVRPVSMAGTATWSGTGNIRTGSGAAITNSGTWDVQNDQTITNVFGGAISTFTNTGTFRKTAGTATTVIGLPFSNSGAFRVQSGAVNLSGGYTQGAGTTTLAGGNLTASGTISIQGGSLGGVGTVTSSISNAGLVSPGNSPGTLTITGNYTQTSSGLLAIEIGGTGAGSFDQLVVIGTATLAGTLFTSFTGGFNASASDTFTILNAASRIGTFSSVVGLSNTVTYNATTVVLGQVVGVSELTLSKAHTGNFALGQTGAYTLTASNGGPGPTSGPVTVIDTLPAGLTATAIGGTGWTCALATLTCSRSDALAVSASYPVITLTVSVASNAAASVTNTAAVSGGGESNTVNDTATDVTLIVATGSTPAINALSDTPSGLSVALAPFYGGPFVLTVNGTNFESGAIVSVGSVNLTTDFVSTSQLTAQVTAAALFVAGPRPVKVTNPGGGNSNTFDLKIVERGDPNGTRTINIGDALACALTVGEVTKPALSLAVGDLNLSGSVNIGDCLAEALFAGRVNDNFTVPAINSVSPSPAIPGSPLTITGSGLTSGVTTVSTMVMFTTTGNSVVRVAPSSAAQNSVTVTVPANAVSGPLQVYRLDVPLGGAEFSLPVSGSTPALTLTGISPYFGVTVGTSISLTGTGFDASPNNNLVLFKSASGTTPATVTAASPSSMTVTVPGDAVCGPVSVTAGGQTSNARTVTVAGPVCGVQLTDIWGGGAPGDTVVIEGAGFNVITPADNVVRFTTTGGGTVIAPVLAAGGTQLQVRIPDPAIDGDLTVTVGAVTSNALVFHIP